MNTIQLIAKGIQDQYLFGDVDPSQTCDTPVYSIYGKNPFLRRYNRSVNFMSEHKRLIFPSAAQFGHSTSCVIPRLGSFVGSVYLSVQLPKLEISSGTYAAWANAIGQILVRSISLEIASIEVEKHGMYVLDIINECETSVADKEVLRDMIGKFDFPNFAQTGPYRLGLGHDVVVIPLRFQFNKSISDALCLAALKHHDVVIRLTFSDFEDCVVYDGVTPPNFSEIVSAEMIAKYYQVDESVVDELFTQNTRFLYLMEQTNHLDEFISSNRQTFHLDLDFNHPVRVLYWMFIDITSEENNDWFNYLRRDDGLPIMKDASLVLDGNPRTETLPESYFRTIQPLEHGITVSDRAIYQYHFDQGYKYDLESPSGSINFSRLDRAILRLSIRPGGSCRLHAVAKNWNFLVIQNGFASIMFQS